VNLQLIEHSSICAIAGRRQLSAQTINTQGPLFNATVLNYLVNMARKDDSGPDQGQAAVDALEDIACTHAALRRAARQLGNLYDEALSPTELKATQVALLQQIDKLGGQKGSTLQALAEEMAISISALTYALRPLVRDDLVQLRGDEHDKRTKHAVLTKTGRKRLSEGRLLWAAANGRVETVLGSKSAGMLRALADRVSSKEFLDAYKASRSL
jgi:DNA-binding MarR family transcriptional regulator